jgi:hypothetical protein
MEGFPVIRSFASQRSMPLKKCTWVYLEDLQDFLYLEQYLIHLYLCFCEQFCLWNLCTLEGSSLIHYTCESVPNLIIILVSASIFSITSLKTSPRCHYTVVDLSWTPLLLSVIVRSVDILLWVSEFHTSVLCPWGVFFRALAVVMLCRRYWFTWLSLFCQHWGEVKPCLQLQFHVLTLQYFSTLPQSFVIKSFFFFFFMKVSGLIKLKISSATNTTLLSSFSVEGTTDFVMRDCVNKLKYCKCENGGAIC